MNDIQTDPKSNIEEILTKIIDYRGDNNNRLLNKFTVQYLISIIEKDKIAQLEKAFKEYDKKGLDIIDFVRVFLNVLEHQPFETLYLIMSLIELFRLISENLNNAAFIKFQDLTNFVCDSYTENAMDDYVLKTKKLPEPKRFNTDRQGVREIDIQAPPILGTSEESLRRLVQTRIVTDSSHHNNQSIKMGHFAREIRKVFTLDSLSDRISMYDLDCKLEKELRQRNQKEKKDVIILSFAWSDRQQRIGATMKDFSLIFWDAYDKFEFEKQFFVTSGSNEYQTNIWFIDYVNQWMTTDRSNVINVWDIEKESLVCQLSHKRIQSTIIEVTEIPIMKLIAVGSLDKLLTVWDLNKRAMLLIIDLTVGGIHSLLCFKTYQVLVTAGYENSISVYQINPTFLDHDLFGKLVGHNSMVTAIQCIEKTPLLVSADDNGTLKLWDIRSFKCVQTVDVGSKTVITRILDIGGCGKICFLGSRVNFLDFDNTEKSGEMNEDIMYAIKAEYNYMQDELIICTRKDLRFLDLETGRIKKIYRGLLRKQDDEITIFKSVEQNKKFVIGDHRGGMAMFLYSSGEKCATLMSHSNEIASLKVDYSNKLYISGSWDSNVMIQKEEKGVFEVKREIKNCFHGKEVNFLDVSIYHNMIVTISNNKTIYLWDYEYCRLMGCIELDEGIEPTTVCFLNGYGVLLIATTNCRVFIVHFEVDEQNIHYRVLGKINLESCEKGQQDSDEEDQELEKSQALSPQMSPGLRGDPKSPSMKSMKSSDLRASLRASVFLNYRKSLAQQNEEKTIQLQNTEEENSEEFKEKLEKKIANTANKMLIDMEYARDSEDPKECKLFLGFLRGGVRSYDIFRIFTEFALEVVPHANKRMNYNAFRGAKEDFASALKKIKGEAFVIGSHLQKNVIKFNKNIVANFQAHKEQLTTLTIIGLSEKSLLTTSLDCFVKIWSLKGEKIAAVNINHPLPIVWNLKLDRVKRTRKNILFALKIVELIFRRYKRSILLSEEKNINVNSFLKYLSANQPSKPQLKLPNINTEKGPVLLKEEYSPRDLHYDAVKQIYQRELMGPTLKEMEADKQIQIAQKIWRNELGSSEDNAKFFARDYLTKRHEERAYKERDAMLFFEPDFRERLQFVPSYDDYTDEVQKLSKKLETSIKRKKNAKDKGSLNTDKKSPTKIQFKKNLFPPITGTDAVLDLSQRSNKKPESDKKKHAITEFNSNTNNNSSNLSVPSVQNNSIKKTFLEYASVKNLLDSTSAVSQSISLHENSLSLQHEKSSFKNILRNLDKKLKKSQLSNPNLEVPRQKVGDMLINLLDNSNQSHSRPQTLKKNKKPKSRSKSPIHRHLPKNDDEGNASVLNSNDSQGEDIDAMLLEMRKNVQEKVRRNLEEKLILRRKQWEVETKRKIMMEFKNEEVKVKEEVLVVQEKKIKIKEEQGFVGLGKMFSSIQKF